MLRIERKQSVSVDGMHREMTELLNFAKEAGTDAGFVGLPDEFRTRVEPLLLLARQRLFGDTLNGCERRRQRLVDLESEYAACRQRIEKYRTAVAGEHAAARSPRRWAAAVSVTASAVLTGLVLEEFTAVPVNLRLAIILGLAAGLIIINLDGLRNLPRTVVSRWHAWLGYRHALRRARMCTRALERLRTEDDLQSSIHEQAEQWTERMRHALLAEHEYHRHRAALASSSGAHSRTQGDTQWTPQYKTA
jgi:hypothetical protein